MQQPSSEQFGKRRLSDFGVDPSYINTNHGSFGCTPKSVTEYRRDLEDRVEFNAEKWFRTDLEPLTVDVRKYVAKQINCRFENIFLVQNATDAFNGLVKSMIWQKDDVVLLPNSAYTSVQKTLQWVQEKYQIQILHLNFTSEDFQSPQKIQLAIQDFVNAYPKKIRCAVFDHISSFPSVVFPIRAIKAFLDEKNIQLFVDGAHAMCQVDINLTDLNCQAYFSNFHKWAFTPKNAAFIYLSDKYIKFVRPAITGIYKGQGIEKEYFWTGTRDIVPYLCAPKGIEYFKSFGENKVHNYNRGLIVQAANLMAKIWNTELLTSDQRCISYMANVRVPSNDKELLTKIHNELFEKENLYFVCGQFDGRFYCRICAQLYNELSDYETLAKKVLQKINQ